MPLIIFLILEMIVFALVVNAIGWAWALLLIILGSFTGLLLMRFGNIRMAQKLQQRMGSGEVSIEEMMRFPFQMIAGLLLFIPGFITDLLAIICLLPSARRIILRRILQSNRFRNRVWTARQSAHWPTRPSSRRQHSPQRPASHRSSPANDDQHTIEGEFWQDEDNKK